MIRQLLVVTTLFFAMLTSAQSLRAQNPTGADEQEVKAYRLTMEKITKLNAATKSLRKLAATDPTVCHAMAPEANDDPTTLTRWAKRIEATHPKVVPLLKSEGLTVREALVIAMAEFQTAMALYAKSVGTKELPDDVSPENVAFMEKNKKEIDTMSAELKRVPDPCGVRKIQVSDSDDEQ